MMVLLKYCPIVDLCPAASLINYGQRGRKQSRHRDICLCGTVRRVITFMSDKGRHPGMTAVAHRQAIRDRDKYNRLAVLVRHD